MRPSSGRGPSAGGGAGAPLRREEPRCREGSLRWPSRSNFRWRNCSAAPAPEGSTSRRHRREALLDARRASAASRPTRPHLRSLETTEARSSALAEGDPRRRCTQQRAFSRRRRTQRASRRRRRTQRASRRRRRTQRASRRRRRTQQRASRRRRRTQRASRRRRRTQQRASPQSHPRRGHRRASAVRRRRPTPGRSLRGGGSRSEGA